MSKLQSWAGCPSYVVWHGRPARVGCVCGRSALLGLALGLGLVKAGDIDHRGAQFLGWDNTASWSQTNLTEGSEPAVAAAVCLTSKEATAALSWDELVVSWNAETPEGSGLKIEARGIYSDRATKFYTLALWSANPAKHPRASVPNQRDDDGDVLTDILRMSRPCQRFQLRLTLRASGAGVLPRVKFLGAAVVDRKAVSGALTALPANRAVWGKSLEVPERSQVHYPEGVNAWCSPTSVSMVLAYWAARLARPELDYATPKVAEAVFDASWPGTGNWPFNTAFAGSLAGMRAYITRLTDVSELEDWIAAGVPVVVSVSYNTLRGKPRSGEADGHLVVCLGFTEGGDVIVNDPGTGKDIRRTFLRRNLVEAWAHSRNTVYLIHPEAHPVPGDRFGHWFPSLPPSQKSQPSQSVPGAE